MAITPLDSALFGALLSDEEVAPLFADKALVAQMIVAERALARAEGQLGVIPADAAAAIDAALRDCAIMPETLASGTAADGVPVPALVKALRRAVGGTAGHYVHWGATSQDIHDTALVCQLRDALAVMQRRLDAVIGELALLAERHRQTPMLGRTRGQQATPTSFGLKVAGWAMPLLRHRQRLVELTPRVMVAALGGAVGNLAALGDQALAVADGFAAELGLTAALMPWHAQRDGLVELAGWCALVSGSLGKIAQDVILLSQNEVGELREGAGGGSSTMPNKANPVLSEALVALARTCAGLAGQLGQTTLHAQERDGAAWQQEWLLLPQIVVACSAALARMESLLDDLVIDKGRMAANLRATNGLVMAEAASFALAGHMSRPEAQALVKAACTEVAETGRHLVDVLAVRTAAPVDWGSLRQPGAGLGQSDALIDRVIAKARDVVGVLLPKT